MAGAATPTLGTATVVAVLTLAVLADTAAATTGQPPIAVFGIGWQDVNPVHWVGEGFKEVGDVVFGGLKLGAKEIAQLIGTIVLAILDMLIPDWVTTAGPKVIAWIVAVENWGTHGGQLYRSINGLQGTLKWIGIALLTTGGTWSGLRVLAGHEAVEDVIRAWATAVFGIVLFRWGWGQATTLTNSITDLILAQPGVSKGLTSFVAVIGGSSLAASGGLVLPLLMIVAAIVFIVLLAAKTMLLIVGALVYVTGQFAFALRVWPGGHAILRAWWSLAAAVFAIPLVWTLIFAVGGVMIADALRVGAGGVIEMNAGKVFQSWMLAIAAVMTIVVAVKAAQAIFGMAKMAPLALISSMGGGLSAGGAAGGNSSAGKAIDAATGGRSAGEAAQSLRSNSERSMDAASTGDTLGGSSSQALTTRAAQAAGHYFGGPAGGAAAGAVAGYVANAKGSQTSQQDAGGGQAGSDQAAGDETAGVASGTVPVPQVANESGAYEWEDGVGMGRRQPEEGEDGIHNPHTGEEFADRAADNGAPNRAMVGPDGEKWSSRAVDHEPGGELHTPSAPPPGPGGTSRSQAHSTGAPIPNATGGGESATSGGPTGDATAAPAAPPAASRSIGGLPTDDARAAFGTSNTNRRSTSGAGRAGTTFEPSQPGRPQRPNVPSSHAPTPPAPPVRPDVPNSHPPASQGGRGEQ